MTTEDAVRNCGFITFRI